MKRLLLIILFFISLVGFSQTPGGVSTTNLKIWLSGDDGFTPGATVTWGDKGSEGNDAYQGGDGSNHPSQDEFINFNEAITFDGNDYLAIESLNYPAASNISDLNVFVVYKTDFSGGGNGNWSFIDFDRSDVFNFIVRGDTGKLRGSYPENASDVQDFDGTSASNNDIPHLGTFVFNSGATFDTTIRLDGDTENEADIMAGNITTKAIRYGYIGSGSEATSEGGSQGGGGPYTGEIAEIIYFDNVGFDIDDEVLRIESYLALKYGITLDVSNGEYLDSNSNALWENNDMSTYGAATETTYWNNIAGLIKDDVTGSIDQKVAKSVGSELIVSIDSDDYTSSNGSRTTSLSNDGDYLLFGDNGETGYEEYLMTGDNILRTKWLFKEGTNNTGTVSLAMPIDFFPEGTTVELIESSDDTFNGSDTRTASTTSTDGDYYYWDLDIADGDRFSFIVTDIQIAGVSVTNFDIYVRADVSDTTGGNLLLKDESFNNANAYQTSTGDNIPDQSNLMNFNPTLDFNGTSDYLYIQNKSYTHDEEISNLHAFVVYSTSFESVDYNDNWAFLDFDRSDAYNMYIHGDGRLAFSYQSPDTGSDTKDLYSNSLGNDGLPHIAEFIFDSSLTNETFMKFDGNIEYNENLTTNNIIIDTPNGGSDPTEEKFGFIGDGSEAESENGTRNNIYFEGQISELILADRQSFNATESLKIDTYLALKYGITLHNSLVNYINSSGTVLWDDTDYWSGVAGLITDNVDSALEQKIAQSTSSKDIILSLNTDFTSSNLDGSRTNALAEGSSLLFGNNGLSTGYTDYDGLAVSSEDYITSRKWLFKEVGTSYGAVNVAIPKSFFPDNATVVEYVISTDEDFTDDTVLSLSTSGDGDYYYFSRDIADGEYLAFILTIPTIPSPGGFSDGLGLWIKTDKNAVSSNGILTSIGGSSVNGYGVSQSTNVDKPKNDELFNYNPTITFDGTSDHLAVEGLNFTSSAEINKMYAWVVYETTSTDATNGSLLSFDGNEYFDVSVSGTNGNLNFSYTTTAGTGVSNTGTTVTNDGVAKIAGFIQNEDLTNATVVRLNGSEELANNTNDTTIGDAATRFGYVGDGSTATTFDGGNDADYFDGKIAEIIYYQDEELDALAINRVESYLAIKYGIHLSGNYVNSAGTTIWDATANATYHNNVFGLVKDDDSELEQKQSKSLESNGVLTVSVNSSIAATNAEITGTFSDLDYLLIGNDGGGSAITIVDAGGGIGNCLKTDKKINRDWKVSASGSITGLTLSFDVSALPDPNNYELIIDDDEDFSSIISTDSGGVLTSNNLVFTGVSLDDGQFFTLISKDETGQVIYGNGVWFGGTGTDSALSTGETGRSVQILEDVTLPTNATCDCINIATGATVTVSDGNYLNLEDEIELDGNLYLEGDAELIQTNTTGDPNTGTGSVYKVIKGATSSGYRYNYLTSPVNTSGTYSLSGNIGINDGANLGAGSSLSFTNADSDGYGTTVSSNWLYTLNGTNYTKIDEDTDLDPGVGFTMKGANQANEYIFIGSPNNDDVTALSIVTDEYAIVGNPYPSAIDADDFNTDMLASNITDGTIYLWDQPTGDSHYQDQYDGGYATIVGGVSSPAAGVTSASTPTGILKPGQGFVVVGGTTGGNIVFTNSMRISNTSSSGEKLFKTSKASLLKPIIRLGFEFESEKGTFHRQLVTTPNGGTLAHDQGKDAKMLDGYGNDAYWLVEDSEERYVITSVPVVSEDLSLDIGVSSDGDKEITFTLDKTESFTNGIYLLDKESAVITNIREDDYKATVSNGQTTDRFSLVFKEAATLDSEIIDVEKKTVVYIEEELIHIVLEEDGGVVNSVKLYDLTGREHIDYKNPSKTSNVSISTKGIKNKVMVLKVVTTHGTFTKKIML